MRRIVFVLMTVILGTLSGLAQEPVEWKVSVTDEDTEHPLISVEASIAPGYHLYTQNNPPGCFNPLEFSFPEIKGVEPVGNFQANEQYSVEYDDIFGVQQYYYTGTVTFTQRLRTVSPNWRLILLIRGQASDENRCVQIKEEFKVNVNSSREKRNNLPNQGTIPVEWD